LQTKSTALNEAMLQNCFGDGVGRFVSAGDRPPSPRAKAGTYPNAYPIDAEQAEISDLSRMQGIET
jgi:hypothetical protein